MRLPARLKLSKHGVYNFRYVVPKRLRTIFGKSEIKKSLGTRDPVVARQLAYLMNAKLVEEMRSLGDLMSNHKKNPFGLPLNPRVVTWTVKPGEISAKPGKDQEGLQKFIKDNPNLIEDFYKSRAAAGANAMSQMVSKLDQMVTPPGIKPITISGAMEPFRQYLNTNRKNTGTRKKYAAAATEFSGLFGSKFLHQITKDQILEFRDSQTSRGLKPVTIENKIIALNEFFGWAQGNLHFPQVDLPTKGMLHLSKRQRESLSEKYQPFTFDDLKVIFDPVRYLPAMSRQPDHFWLPILALFTGARIEELCQLHIADVKKLDGVAFIDINAMDDKGVKSAAGARKIPLHPIVLKLGFLKYVEVVKSMGLSNKQIFPYLQPNANDVLSSPASKKFNRYFSLIGIKSSRRKVFHSFRKTANQELTDRGVDVALRSALLGHELKSENVNSYTEYRLKQLAEQGIYKLKFEGQALQAKSESISWSKLKFETCGLRERIKSLIVSVAADSGRRQLRYAKQSERARSVKKGKGLG